jgi:hypothetical protein
MEITLLKIFKHNYYIFLFLFLEIYLINIINKDVLFLIIFILNTLIIFMSILIQYNYYLQARYKTLIIEENKISILDRKTDKKTSLKINEIEKIEQIKSYNSKMPWNLNEYIILKDKKKNEIIINSYLTNLINLRMLNNFQKENIAEHKIIERFYPIIINKQRKLLLTAVCFNGYFRIFLRKIRC